MARTERFTSFNDLDRELQRLNEVRQRHEDRLERHWKALQDREVRGALMSDAVGDVVRAWKPTRVLGSLFGGGSFGASLGAALGTRRGGMTGKLFSFALSMALPKLLERLEHLSVDDIGKHLRTTVERVGQYIAKRREERHAEQDA